MHVHFALKADLCFSSELGPDARAAVDAAVKEANGQLFCRGVPKGVPPEEVGRITLWEVEENILFLEIESGGYTRAHDALFRFRKLVGTALGKYQLGLREIRTREFRVILTGDVPETAIPHIRFIRSARCEAGRVALDLDVTTQDLENRIPDRIVKLIEEKVQAAGYGGKTEHWELLYESPKRGRAYTGNPTEEMEKRHWIRHGSSRGQWIYGPQPIQLFRAFTSIVEEEIIQPLGFSEMVFPKVDTWDVLSRSGHAKGVYPEIYYVCTPKTRDPAFWEDVADSFKVTGEVPVEMLRERIDGPIGALCYAQCPSFWPFVQGRTIANSSLPVKIFDRSGTSHRYESGGIHGIERVDEFHRIEIVWFGTVEQTT
ncbi:MAG: serine--tRNA ligase, partial [Methanomicrobiales archaeon]|nr:serine--tRNA ligase [Methanomicrobiales archaeon]